MIKGASKISDTNSVKPDQVRVYSGTIFFWKSDLNFIDKCT